MTTKLTSIEYRSPGRYEVRLHDTDTGNTSVFDFEVDVHQNIEFVKPGDAFAAHVRSELARVSPVIQAVLQFHRARKIELP
jgi:hypothetical protein